MIGYLNYNDTQKAISINSLIDKINRLQILFKLIPVFAFKKFILTRHANKINKKLLRQNLLTKGFLLQTNQIKESLIGKDVSAILNNIQELINDYASLSTLLTELSYIGNLKKGLEYTNDTIDSLYELRLTLKKCNKPNPIPTSKDAEAAAVISAHSLFSLDYAN